MRPSCVNVLKHLYSYPNNGYLHHMMNPKTMRRIRYDVVVLTPVYPPLSGTQTEF